MVERLKAMVEVIGCIASLGTAAMWTIKPIREKVFNLSKRDEGTKCLLRTAIVETYYKHVKEASWREYEYQNIEKCYEAYKAQGGNSFIDHLYSEMQEWAVVR